MIEWLTAIGVFLLGLSAFLTFVVTFVVKMVQYAKEPRMQIILLLAFLTTLATLLGCLIRDFL